MTFTEMLKMFKKDKDLTFKSDSAFACRQDIKSIKFWLFKAKISKEDFNRMLDAKDWEVEKYKADKYE